MTHNAFCLGSPLGGGEPEWPGFTAESDSSSYVDWTQLWVVPAQGARDAATASHQAAAKQRHAAAEHLARRAAEGAAQPNASISGYDIIVIAGQSNAVGSCGEDGFGHRDSTEGLPVHSFLYGTVSGDSVLSPGATASHELQRSAFSQLRGR